MTKKVSCWSLQRQRHPRDTQLQSPLPSYSKRSNLGTISSLLDGTGLWLEKRLKRSLKAMTAWGATQAEKASYTNKLLIEMTCSCGMVSNHLRHLLVRNMVKDSKITSCYLIRTVSSPCQRTSKLRAIQQPKQQTHISTSSNPKTKTSTVIWSHSQLKTPTSHRTPLSTQPTTTTSPRLPRKGNPVRSPLQRSPYPRAT